MLGEIKGNMEERQEDKDKILRENKKRKKMLEGNKASMKKR